MINNEHSDPFINVSLGEDTRKLANLLYHTYRQEEDPYLLISVKRLCELFGFKHFTCSKEEKQYLRDLFDELNEPIRVVDFHYGNRHFDWKVLQFCDFEKPWEDEDEHIELVISEMFIAVIKAYEDDSFITAY